MKRSVKNYLCITGMLIILYAFGLTMVGTQEERSRRMEISQTETAPTPVVSYVLAGLEGAGFAALLGWYILSRQNEKTFSEVCATKSTGMRLSVSALAGCASFAMVALMLSGSLLHPSLPQFSMPEIQNPVAANPEPEPDPEPEPEPEPETPSGTNPADDAAADQVVDKEPLDLQNAQLAGNTADSSVLATGKGGALSLVASSVQKTGDAQDVSTALASGVNSAVLVRLGGTASILGSDLYTSANGAAAAAVSGSGSTATISDTTLHTDLPDSSAALSAFGGTMNLSQSTLLSQSTHSPAMLVNETSTITGSTLLIETSGPLSPVAEVYGTLSASGLNANAMQGMAFRLHSASKTEVLSSTVSCSGAGENGVDGLFVLDGLNAKGEQKKEKASLEVNNSSILFNPGSQAALSAPVFNVSQASASITCIDSILSTDNGLLMKLTDSDVELNLENQSLYGRMQLDGDSSLKISLKDGSSLGLSVQSDQAKTGTRIHLDATSVLSLSSDLDLEALENEDSTGSNIQTNGFALYVQGKPWTGGAQ